MFGVGYPGNTCGDAGGSFVAHPENATLTSSLEQFIPVHVADEAYGCLGSACYLRGYLYSCTSLNPPDDCVEPQLVWGLEGIQDASWCEPATQVFYLLGDTFCIYTIEN